MRKPWAELSPAYRRRLERSGITPESHRAGVPLFQARGHFPRDPQAGYVRELLPGKPRERGRLRLDRESYRDASSFWQKVRRDPRFRDVPKPIRQTLRQAIFVDREYRETMVRDVLQMYSDARRDFRSNPQRGERQDVYEKLDNALFVFQAEWGDFDYDWFDELYIYYH